MNQSRKAACAIAATMFIWGTLGPFVRGIGLPSAEVALWRAVLAVACIGLFFMLTRRRIDPRRLRAALPLITAAGAAMGANWILLFEAYRFTTVSIATLSYYFAPVLIMAASPILFGERVRARQVACFFGAALGLVLVIDPSGAAAESTRLTGVLLGLGAALLYACVVLVNKKIADVDGIDRTLFEFAAAIAVLLPYVLLTGGTHLGQLDARGAACLLTVGVVHSGVAYCLYFSALGGVTGQKAAILSYIDPLVAMAMSATVLGEPIGALQLVGGALILGSTLLNEILEDK